MSLLFVALVALSAFFAALSMFQHPARRGLQRVVRPGRWSPRTRPSLRARLRRA